MSMRLSREFYAKLIQENIDWLKTMPRTLERDHILMILKEVVDDEYGPKKHDQMMEDEKLFRRLLFLRHGDSTHALYGDDGEMQCSKCGIDFKRMSPKEIDEAFVRIGMAQMAGQSTVFHAMKHYDDLLQGRISLEEYGKTKDDD